MNDWKMNYFTEKTIIIFVIFLLIYFLLKILHQALRSYLKQRFIQKQKTKQIPIILRLKSDFRFNKLNSQFKRKFSRNPTRDELFKIIVHVSHMSIGTKGFKGHWKRQAVRKYLLEKHGIAGNYAMK